MEHPSRTLCGHNTYACYPQEKWPNVRMAVQGREHSILAMEWFQRKRHNFLIFIAC